METILSWKVFRISKDSLRILYGDFSGSGLQDPWEMISEDKKNYTSVPNCRGLENLDSFLMERGHNKV